MITKDNYLVLGVMNQHTSMPSTVKFIGGAFSEIDIKNGVFEVASCIEREVFEELGIRLSQIQTQEQVQTFILTRANFSFMNTLQIKSIELGKAEFIQAFHQFQTSEMAEQELSDVLFIKNDPEAISLFVQENEEVLVDYMQEFFLVYNQMIQPSEMTEKLVD